MNTSVERNATGRKVALVAAVVALVATAVAMPVSATGMAPGSLAQAGNHGGPGGSYDFGFSPGGWFPDVSDAELNRDLDLMVEVGAQWLRLDFDWSEIERRQGRLHWHRTDRVVDAANARGIKVLGIINEAPRWARPPNTDSTSPPSNPSQYATFAAAAVERYDDRGVEAWQLWNEPNLALFWSPRPDPAAYARLTSPAIAAMKSVDPNATIVAAGFAPAADRADRTSIHPKTFLRGMLDAGATGFDAYGSHPFSFPARPLDPQSASWNPFIQLPELHQILRDRGLGHKKIWLTEYGAPTGTSVRSVGEAEQSAEILEALVAAQEWDFTGPMFLYSHRDERHAPGDWLANMGLRRHDGTPKQAWRDLANLVATSGGGNPNDAEPEPEPAGATIGGAVRDDRGNVVPGARANLFEADHRRLRSRFLGVDHAGAGSYRFGAAPDCYVLVLIAPNSHHWQRTGGKYRELHRCLAPGQSLTIDGTLIPNTP
ncbi:MAG: cellulase family glycosylhydrolase [Acidimicrobiales bacterium]